VERLDFTFLFKPNPAWFGDLANDPSELFTFKSEPAGFTEGRMRPRKAYEWLLSHSREIACLESMRSLLIWDQRVCMPTGGHSHRAVQFGALAELLSAKTTDPKIGQMLERVEESRLVEEPLCPEAVNVREWRRSFDRAVKVPRMLAVELARAAAEGELAWEVFKPRNDWKSFMPYLKRIVELKRNEASLLDSGNEFYDALLNDYEPGETAENIEPLFGVLKEALLRILYCIENSNVTPDRERFLRHYPEPAQEALAREAVRLTGYDFNCGRMDPAAHPFTASMGPRDVRITTRYDTSCFGMAFFSALHETGHGLYDQGLDSGHWGTPMGRAASMGLHESQALTWENWVGRSLGFWEFFYPRACRFFPHLAESSLESFHLMVNDVQRSLIRTEADEVTYNLHVMLRFELELALIRYAVEVRDLPELWEHKTREYLGLCVPDHSRGLMQDIHWAEGSIGYFPVYVLGNLCAAQLFARAEDELGELEALFSRGEFAPFIGWLRSNVHVHGSRYRPRELLKEVTGEDLNPKYFIAYLVGKYGPLYGFDMSSVRAARGEPEKLCKTDCQAPACTK